MTTKSPVKIGLIGSGKMGTDIFNYLAGFGFELAWLCETEPEAAEVRRKFIKKTERQFKNQLIDEQCYQRLMQTTVIGHTMELLSGCELIIEAITEKINVKQELFHRLDGVVNPDCIFASNSSSIVPSLLLSSAKRKDKMVGLHFFYPVSYRNIVEYIYTDSTSETTHEKVHYFLSEIKKFHLNLTEKNAFILNKLFLNFQAEACRLYRDGIDFQQIDDVVKEKIFPIGIFDFFDSVGIDTMLFAVNQYIINLDKKEFYQPLIASLQSLYNQGRLGIKTKAGFYDYAAPALPPGNALSPSQKDEMVQLLTNTFKESFNTTIQNGICTRQELDFALTEYLGEKWNQ